MPSPPPPSNVGDFPTFHGVVIRLNGLNGLKMGSMGSMYSIGILFGSQSQSQWSVEVHLFLHSAQFSTKNNPIKIYKQRVKYLRYYCPINFPLLLSLYWIGWLKAPIWPFSCAQLLLGSNTSGVKIDSIRDSSQCGAYDTTEDVRGGRVMMCPRFMFHKFYLCSIVNCGVCNCVTGNNFVPLLIESRPLS